MSLAFRRNIALVVLAFVACAASRPVRAQAPPPPYPAPSPYPPPPYAQNPPPGYAPPVYQQYPPPGYAPYPQYQLPPPQLVMVHRRRTALVIAGGVTFAVSWGLALMVSLVATDGPCTSNCDAAGVMWIPIAGPALAMSRDSGPNGEPAFFVAWTLAEVAGVVMFAIGMAGHDVQQLRYAERGPAFRLAPLIARNASGLALTARW